jgi:hypothetical protein
MSAGILSFFEVCHALDADEHLVEMPSVSWLRPSSA